MFRKLLTSLCVCVVYFNMYAIVNASDTDYEMINVNLYEPRESIGLFSLFDDEPLITNEAYNEIYETVYLMIKYKITDCIIFEQNYTDGILKYSIPLTTGQEAIFDIIFDVISDNSDLYYLNPSLSFSFINPDGNTDKDSNGNFIPNGDEIIIGLELQYFSNCSSDLDIVNYNAELDYIIDSLIVDGMSDAEKALVLYDYLSLNVEYDHEYADNQEADNANHYRVTAHSVIIEGKGVCQGYALAYSNLLSKVGIKSKFVTSNQMNHAWNLVKIGDYWYHVDTTWADRDFVTISETIDHRYFLVSEERISELKHYGWNFNLCQKLIDELTGKCNDKTFESGYCFNEVKTVDGDSYMVLSPLKYRIENDEIYYCYYRYLHKITTNADGVEQWIKYSDVKPIIYWSKFKFDENAVVKDENTYNNIVTEKPYRYQDIRLIGFYDIDGRLISVSKSDVNNYYRIIENIIPQNTKYINILYWDNFIPMRVNEVYLYN